MNTSNNFQFNLPQSTDTVDISKISDNFDNLDTELQDIKTRGENNELFIGSKALLKTDATDTLVAAINEVNSHADTNAENLSAEVTRATKAEGDLTTNLSAEVTRATKAEETLTTNLNAEITRAKNAESANSSAISAEKERAEGAESTLTTNLNGEIERAKKAESANSTAISDEVTRAKAAEQANADAISSLKTQSSTHGTNVSNLTKRVAVNESAIATLNGTGDGSVAKQVSDGVAKIVANAPEDFDTLKEISDWISSHKSDASAMNTAITENTTNLNAEVERAKAAEKANADAIANIDTSGGGVDLPSVIENYYALRRTGKQYAVQVPKFAVNQSSTCTKIGINANLNYTPSTDTEEGVDDYENIPLFQWVHVVYKRYSDGAPYPVAIEGTKEYDDLLATGACDVGAMQMSFYVKFDSTNDAYDVITISDMPFDGAVAWSECRRADGTVLPWCIGSSYYSSLGDDGLLHSLPNRAPVTNQSYNTMCEDYPKKGKGYQGAGCERMTFSYIFMTIKGATKNIQTLYQGCTNYITEVNCAVAESDAKRVVVATDDGEDYCIGSSIMLVENDDYDNPIVSNAVILSKESVTIDSTEYTAINLDLDSTITTTTSLVVSTIYWQSGSTDKVLSHRDGSYVSNTDAKHPFRIQGREYRVGGLDVASDTMFWLTSTGRDIYVYPKGTTHVQNSNTNAVKVGTIPFTTDGLIGDIAFDPATGVYWVATKGSNSGVGIGDYFYAGGTSTNTLREYLIGGDLWAGSDAGFYLHAWYSLSDSDLRFLGAD